ncbi:MAG: HPr(Ser) kinase/phosphatase [Candidatus Edwardsbacteria bacterium]
MEERFVTVEELLKERGEIFELTLLSGEGGLKKKIISMDINRPGLALAGYTGYFLWERIQIIGATETSYLETLPQEKRKEAVNRILTYELPCLIVTKGLKPTVELKRGSEEKDIPLFTTPQDTTPFIHSLTSYLEHKLAPQTTMHGTLVDVYGVGLLYTGESGIGKSECALDLVVRGHRLVADDVITIKRRGQGILIGYGNELLLHHMEIRGIGIVDLVSLYGIRAIRMRKRIELEVRLKRWSDEEDYDRLGLVEQPTTILGVEIPLVTVPVNPGKNISVISEVVAMNHLLKISGYRSAEEFHKRLLESMQRRFEAVHYLEDDLE